MFPAVQAAEKAVELAPTWAIARQTLGRAQLGLGEVYMVQWSVVQMSTSAVTFFSSSQKALQTFKKALHLDPQNNEVKLFSILNTTPL